MINVSTCNVKRDYWSLGAVYQPPDGRTVGRVGTAYTFQFMSWDLDGDPIKYRINWGDGTPLQDTPAGTGGVLITATHSWTTAGTYNVKVQAVQTVGGVEGASAWSPFYAFNVTATSGSKLEGFLLMGPSGNAASSATKRVVMTVGEPVVSKMGSASYGVSLGYQGMLTTPNAGTPLTLGPAGPGGQETLPPSRPTMSATLTLTGSTSAEVTQIAQSLRQNPLAQLRDANGNYRISNGKWIKFDANNRPTRIITSDGTKTDMVYTYDGARVKKTVTPPSGPAVMTLYIGDIYEKTGTQVTTHIFAGGQRIASKTGAAVLYFHQDHLGSTSLITNSAGAVVQTTKYLPFGATWSSSGSLTDINFTGHRIDASDGLIYAGARYYDPAMGRFITPDTMVSSPYNPQSLNRYAYCDNNPINFTDPTGNWKLKNFLKSVVDVAAVAGMVAVTIYCPATAIYWGAAIGAAHGGVNTGLSGGSWNQAFQSAAIGGASGLVGGYVGGSISGAARGAFGLIGGGIVTGGISGAAGGATGAALTPGSNGEDIWRATYQSAAAGAVVGGVFGLVESGIQARQAAANRANLNTNDVESISQEVQYDPPLPMDEAHNATNAQRLNLQVASDSQLSELGAGGGRIIAGPGSNETLDVAHFLATKYGGNPGDWSKVTSSHYQGNGIQIQIHAFRNVRSGQDIQYKTEIKYKK